MKKARVIVADDINRVVEILVGAFYSDPTWSWAFPDPDLRREQHSRLWRLMVEGAARYPTVWLNGDETATSVWVPPGGTEMSPEQEALLEPLLEDMLGNDADRLKRTFEAFDAVHPTHDEFYYLTLLGTDPDHLGKGLGFQLLEDNLRVVDEAGMPAYLEASNSANVGLYARYGFKEFGKVELPGYDLEVTTMWRDRV